MTLSNIRRLFRTDSGRRTRLAGVPALLFILAMPAAFAQLERVGPVSPTNGYPTWFQDKTGLTLEFCTPTVQAELDGGWCVLLPGDTTAPEVFPTSFFDEHFYFLANAAGTTTFGGKAKLVLAMEGAFSGAGAIAGDQIVFARVRVVVTGLPPGTYKVYHPYGSIGPITLDGVGHTGDKLFVTDDVGLACAPGQFDCALAGQLGPWLLPSAAPGGAEIPAVTANGKLYIADPARLGPITGSPIGHNYFRVVSVVGTTETDIITNGPVTDFSLAGRVYTGSIPGRVTVDRASYTNDGTSRRVDVFASVFPTLQARIPGSANAAAPTPALGYYHGPCDVADAVTGALKAPIGQLSAAMRTAGHVAWGQSTFANNGDPIPFQVCVEDKTSATFTEGNVTDDVRITQATYDPSSLNLTVKATSSDTNTASGVELTVVYPGGSAVLPGGSGTIVGVPTPPSRIQVRSNKRGTGQSRITTNVLSIATPLTDILAAQNLIASTPAGTPVVINIPNAGASGNLISIVTPPSSGIATANLDGNGNADTITYTPAVNTGGQTATFMYTLTSGCEAPCTPVTSNTAIVTINITGVVAPPPPVAPTEVIVVSAAAYRTDQKRWTVNGTDNLLGSVTIVNIGPATGTPKFVIVGPAVVFAGVWALDIKGVAVAPVAGDRVVAIKGNITSQPLTASFR